MTLLLHERTHTHIHPHVVLQAEARGAEAEHAAGGYVSPREATLTHHARSPAPENSTALRLRRWHPVTIPSLCGPPPTHDRAMNLGIASSVSVQASRPFVIGRFSPVTEQGDYLPKHLRDGGLGGGTAVTLAASHGFRNAAREERSPRHPRPERGIVAGVWERKREKKWGEEAETERP